MRWLYLTLCLAGCGVTQKTVTVEKEYESTLNTYTEQDSAYIILPLVPAGDVTLPRSITWSLDSLGGGTIPAEIHDITVTKDSLNLTTEEGRFSFIPPAPGERLTIRADSTSLTAFISGAPETALFEVEVSGATGFWAHIGTLLIYLRNILIALGGLGVLALIGYVIYAVIEGKKKEALVKGAGDVLTQVVENFKKPKIRP